MRASKNRCFHLAMVRELSLKLEYKSPAANRKMMRARRAKSARPRPVRARDSRALRSSPVSTMSAVVCGMRHTNMYMSLVQATSLQRYHRRRCDFAIPVEPLRAVEEQLAVIVSANEELEKFHRARVLEVPS